MKMNQREAFANAKGCIRNQKKAQIWGAPFFCGSNDFALTPHLHGENVVCKECSHRLGVQGLNYVPKTTEEIPVAPPVVIEKKSKRYKLRQAVGVVIAIASFGGYLYARNSIGMDNDTGFLVGIGCGVTFLIGLILFLTARIGAWRHRSRRKVTPTCSINV